VRILGKFNGKRREGQKKMDKWNTHYLEEMKDRFMYLLKTVINEAIKSFSDDRPQDDEIELQELEL